LVQENKFVRSLIESAKRGNNAALEQLFKMNLGKIYALSFLLAGDKPSADLITINTFINAWELTDTIDDDTTFSEWIKNIAVHVALNETEKETKIKRGGVSERNELLDNFSSSAVAKSYFNLSDTEKFCLTLNFIENYPAESIAGMLDIETTDVATHITNSIKKVKEDPEVSLSVDSILEQLQNFPTEIIPDENLLKYALDKIYDMKFEDWEKEEKARLKEEIIKHKKNKKEIGEDKKPKREKVKIEIKKPKINFNKNYIFVLLLIVAVVIIFNLISSQVTWLIKIKEGSPELDGKTISQAAEFEAGSTLQTNEFSKAIIKIPNVGKIELFEKTSLQRHNNSYSANLLKGRIKVSTEDEKENFHLNVSSAVIDELYLGTNYSVRQNDRGNVVIKLKEGWLKVTSGETEIIFPAGYNLRILKGTGAGLPYHVSSTSEFINLLEEYIFGRKSDITLDMIIESCSEKDGITLWNLLRIVKPGQRRVVYDKLYKLFPHPDELKREDILSLDENTLNGWLEEIEWKM
jgi:DNA-directed RNA polymerase specialized sigma24 family protein